MSLSVCLSVDEIVFMHVYEQISDNRDTEVYVRPYGLDRSSGVLEAHGSLCRKDSSSRRMAMWGEPMPRNTELE